MSKRQYFVAIPSSRALEREGGDSFRHTILAWDLHPSYKMHTEGDYTLIECNVRGERKRLRHRIAFVYGLPTHTVVR